jgi:hypothetical protein
LPSVRFQHQTRDAKAAENQANGGSSEKARNYAEAAKHLTEAADTAVNRLL